MEILPQHAVVGQGGLAVPPPELSIPRRRAEAAEATARAWQQERGRHWGSGTCTALEGGLTWNVPDII